MINKGIKIVAIIIVLVVAFTGLVYLMMPLSSPETHSQTKILKASDIGPGWQSAEGVAIPWPYPGVTSQSVRYYWIQNAITGNSPEFIVNLIEFNSVTICRAYFAEANLSYSEGRSTNNYSYLSIGDGAFHVQNVGNYSDYEFAEGTVLCWVSVQPFTVQPLTDPESHPYFPSWDDVLLNIVNLQLIKIDQ